MSLSIPAHKEKYFLSKSKSHFFEVLLILFFSAILSATAQQFTEAWTRKLPDAYGRAIEHDSHGDLIILGVGDFGSSVSKMKIWKYDTLGTLLWTQTIIDTAGPFTTLPTGIVVDSLDNIYACAIAHSYGAPPNSPIKEGLLVKLNSAGNLLWYRYFGLNLNRWAEFYDMKLFKNKYIYLAGMSFDALSAKSYLLVQYDSSGAFNWALPTAALCANQYTSVQLDKKGNAYALGYTNCHPPGWDAVLHKYDLQGNLLWSTLVNDTSTYYMNYGGGAIIDDSTNIYITGKCANYNLPGIAQVSVAKVDSNGSVKWFQSLYSPMQYAYINDPAGLLLDSSNNLIVFGKVDFQQPWVSQRFVAKYGPNGLQQWNTFVHNDTNNAALFNTAFIGPNNTINFSGQAGSYGANPSFGINILQYDSNGIVNWNCLSQNRGYASHHTLLNGSVFYVGYKHDNLPNGNVDSLFLCRYNLSLSTRIVSLEKGSYFLETIPNPFNEVLQVNTNGSTANIQILNLYGDLIYFTKINRSGMLDTRKWNQGVYLIRVETEKNVYTKKIIKY